MRRKKWRAEGLGANKTWRVWFLEPGQFMWPSVGELPWKFLDYVVGWFVKAAQYGAHPEVATDFVIARLLCDGCGWGPLLAVDSDQYIQKKGRPTGRP
ncbi:MAG: hypothetical protein EA353_03085 [Puniceicoccaceae bacterium]|nr:MAG: hypothetical protein EA353_03085 [Puniceicoccaceae bacterium]